MNRAQIWIHAAQFVLCVWMVFGAKPAARAQDGARIAVLETRASQIDQHLSATDTDVRRLWDQVQAEAAMLAEIEGEERAAFAILSLLTAGNFIVQLRTKKT